MKIKRLNENIIVPEDSILFDFLNLRKEYEANKKIIADLINEYIDFNREYFDKQYMFDYEYIVDFEISEGRLMLKGPYSKYVRLREEDYNKLLEFLKDPEVYKNTKKYNL